MTYRGWTNYATWRLHERVQTEERLHAARQVMLDRLDRAVTPADVRRFNQQVMDDDAADIIDFGQLSAEWERERRFRRDLLPGRGS